MLIIYSCQSFLYAQTPNYPHTLIGETILTLGICSVPTDIDGDGTNEWNNETEYINYYLLAVGISNRDFSIIRKMTNLPGAGNFQFDGRLNFGSQLEVCTGQQCILDQIPE